jgi:hypothetical protein
MQADLSEDGGKVGSIRCCHLIRAFTLILWNNVAHVWKRSGGAVADGTGPPAPAPPGSGMGQQGSMNNYPMRGGKGGYFEGGIST